MPSEISPEQLLLLAVQVTVLLVGVADDVSIMSLNINSLPDADAIGRIVCSISAESMFGVTSEPPTRVLARCVFEVGASGKASSVTVEEGAIVVGVPPTASATTGNQSRHRKGYCYQAKYAHQESPLH